MQRRQYLKRIGSAGIIASIAGCGGGDGGGNPTDAATPTPRVETVVKTRTVEGEPETVMETRTVQVTEPETPTPTATPEPAVTFGGDDTLDMSLSPSVPQRDLYLQYGVIRDYLETYVQENHDVDPALDARMNVSNNYASVIQALGQGTADWAETGPFAAALGVNSDNAEIILQRKGYGNWQYTGRIAVAPDSDISSLSDLEGKTIAFSDALSTSGFLYPLWHIKNDGGLSVGNLPYEKAGMDFDVTFAGGHVNSYTALKQGQVDASAHGSFVPGIVDDYDANAEMLVETDPIPRAPIVVSSQLPQASKDALREAFMEAPDRIYWGADGEQGTDDDIWFTAVRERGVDTYSGVIEKAQDLDIGADFFEN